MDFHTLTRKELQTLCKKNKIPANITNVAMADALSALPQVEGLDEFLNPGEVEAGSPGIHHRTAGRAATQRKEIKEPESAKSNRRRASAVSTRRKKEPEMLEVDDDDGVQEKAKDVPITPAAAPSNRRRVTGRSVCTKNETPIDGGTSVQRTYNTRRSVRFLETSLSKISLVDNQEDMGLDKIDDVSEEFSGVSSQHIEESYEAEEKGASLQTVSAAVSESTDELEVSSKENNTDYECQSHVSEAKLVSETENDEKAEMQGEPQEECVGKLNHVESEPHDSNLELEGGSELIYEIEQSCDSSELENKDCVGTKQKGFFVEASTEVSHQDIPALTVVAPDDASMDDDTEQDVAGSLQSSVDDASVSLKELADCSIDDNNLGTNEGDDDNQEKNSEAAPMKMNQIDEEDADEKDVASSEGVLELGSSILCSSGEPQEEELEANLVHSEESRAEMEKTEYTSADGTRESSAILAEKDADAGSENCEEEMEANLEHSEESKAEMEKTEYTSADVISEYSAILAEKDADAGSENCEEELEANLEHSEESKEEIEKIEYTSDVTSESSTILAENDAVSENSAAVDVCMESYADKKESMEVENVTIQLALLDVAAHRAEDQKDTDSDTANAFSCVDHQVSVESAGCNSKTVISEDIAIPKQDPYVSAETMTIAAPIHEQKTSDIPIQSVVSDQIKGEEFLCSAQSVANEIQAVNANRMKENLSTSNEFQNMSMRGLKKLLKNKLDGNNSDGNNNVKVVQEVERKRTALQALPQNLMTTGGSSE